MANPYRPYFPISRAIDRILSEPERPNPYRQYTREEIRRLVITDEHPDPDALIEEIEENEVELLREQEEEKKKMAERLMRKIPPATISINDKENAPMNMLFKKIDYVLKRVSVLEVKIDAVLDMAKDDEGYIKHGSIYIKPDIIRKELILSEGN